MRKLLLILFTCNFLFAFATIPSGYYDNVNGKSGNSLYAALESILTNGQSVTSYSGLWTAYKTTDINASGKIWDIYSNCSFTYSTSQCGSYSSECNCYNREHTTPQSWFNSQSPMYSDLFNVYPTDGKVNGMRSNYPFGEVGSATYISENGSKLGTSSFSGYSGVVFEPIDQYKGDIARTYFYMATRYASLCQSWTGEATAVYGPNFGLTPYALNLFLKWSREDPVSEKEKNRNEAVYAIQNNRNPFIDYPHLEEYLWGNKAGSTLSINNGMVDETTLYSPVTGSTVDLGNVAYGHSDTASIYFKGDPVGGVLSLTLSGTGASKFSLSTNIVTDIQLIAGYKVIVTYQATELETTHAQLNISGMNIPTVQVNLVAKSTDQFVALPATDLKSNSFTANWTASSGATGYSLNVYKMKGSSGAGQTLIEDDFNSGLPTGWTTSGYYDSSTSGTLRMASGSQNGLITTPSIDLSSSTNLTIKSKQYSSDTGAKIWIIAGTNDTITSFENTVDFQTFTYTIPAKQANTTLGFYAVKGKRVYLDYVKLTANAPTTENVSGYPKQVANNVFSYPVSGLENNMTYYYTVAPLGNNATLSDAIQVRTLIAANPEIENVPIAYSRTSEGILLKNIPSGNRIIIYTLIGEKVTDVISAGGDNSLNLLGPGIYILRLENKNQTKSLKIIY